MLDSDGGKISDQQKSALEKAASGGKVSQADYERAWADYKQCIIDKGYAEPTFDKYDNGIYALPSYNTDGASKEAAKVAARQNMNVLERAISHLAEIFVPLLPAIITGGLILGFRNVIGDLPMSNGQTLALTA